MGVRVCRSEGVWEECVKNGGVWDGVCKSEDVWEWG